MTEQTFSLDQFQAELAEASAVLNAFARGPAQQAADAVGQSFERAGERIARALGAAASGGETAFKRLAKVMLEELARVALQRLFTEPVGSLPFFGGKAAGGAVNAGGAYLVGERGPELFAPRQSGEIVSAAAGAVTVHFHFAAGANPSVITQNQGQIAAALARAVAYGRRNL